MSLARDGEDYLRMYPTMRRWINECASCHTKGYDPAMPASAKGARNLRRLFVKLPLDENSACEQCAEHNE